jgi:hypothetical protein
MRACMFALEGKPLFSARLALFDLRTATVRMRRGAGRAPARPVGTQNVLPAWCYVLRANDRSLPCLDVALNRPYKRVIYVLRAVRLRPR